MRTPARILVVDDEPVNRDIFETRLAVSGYEILTAADGEEGLRMAWETGPDLILLDVNMPKMDGIEVCRRLRADGSFPFTPIIMVTALADSRDVVAGLEVGADEYLTKPVDQAAMVARVKSMLRIKALHDTVREQAETLEAQSAKLAEWNMTLEERVRDQVSEIERIGRLKRFLSPQVAEALMSSGSESLLKSHRREITVLFCDLRGFTAFSESAEPEQAVEILRKYHGTMGSLIFMFEGTLEHFAGDGMMVFFNAPQPCPDHGVRAVRMAVAMRQKMKEVSAEWLRQGHDMGFGVGIAQGFATMGMVGFEGRVDYGAIGPVVNLAARLCEEAGRDEILIDQPVHEDARNFVVAEPAGERNFKGLQNPVPVFNVQALTRAK